MADDPGAAPAVRTFLIADVRGYTAFTQSHGDEAAARLAARFAATCRAQVHEGVGHLLELRGDEAVLVFDTPRQGLRCAVALQQRFAEATRDDPSLPLRVGMGLDAGEAVSVEGGYRGGALNLAARLCSIAKAGEVLISETVVHLARRVDGIRYADRGRRSFKGIDESVHFYAAQFDLDLPPAERAARPSSRRLAAVAAVTLAVVAAASALAATRLASGRAGAAEISANAVGELDAGGAVQPDQVALSGRPSGIAFGDGSLWVTDQSTDEVDRIDPSTHAVIDRVHTGAAPSGVAVGGGGVWVTNGAANTVTWFSPAEPDPKAIPVGIGPDGVAFGDNAAWVVNVVDGTLQRIDASTLRTSPPLAVGAEPSAVAVGADSVWIALSASNELVRVDPGPPARIAARVSVGNDPTAIVYGGGYVWVANAGDGSVTRIDPSGGPPRVVSGAGSQPEGLAFRDGTLWVADGLGQQVVRIDPMRLQVVGSTRVGAQPDALAAGGNGVWVTGLPTAASHRGGTLKAEVDQAPDSLDPGYAYYLTSWQLLRMTNDGLVAFRPAGGPAGGEVVPDMAQALPAVSADGRTYTFQLRDGLVYSNGTPVRATDFVTAAERQLRVPGNAGARLTYSGLVGASACMRAPRSCSLARGMEADNAAGTVTYHLTAPDPAFLQKLALPFGDAVPTGLPLPGPETMVPATGPYMIRSFVRKGPGAGVMLVRNPRFRSWSTTSRPQGFPDQIRLAFPVSSERQVDDVEQAVADVALTPATSRLQELEARYPELVHRYSPGNVLYLFLNTRIPPFDNVDARRALSYAVDRSTTLKLITGSSLAGVPTCQVLPPNVIGYRPYCPYTLGTGPGGTWTAPDVRMAERLVRRSGTARSRVVVAQGGPGGPATTRYLVRLLHSLGYSVSVRSIRPADYFHFVGNSDHRVGLGVFGWIQDFADPYDFLGQLFTCASFHPGSPDNVNVSQYCDPVFDRLVRGAVAKSSTDRSAASALWQAADRRLVDRAAAVPLLNPISADVVSGRVGNFQHNPEFGVLLDQLWVQ